MLSKRFVKLRDKAEDERVDAVVRPATQSDKVLWTHWHGHWPADAQDIAWDWDELVDWALALPNRFEVYALECKDELQGLRMLEISENEVDTYGVHAMRLSTSPWNRHDDSGYEGVGSVLVAVAIWRSLELGHEGRIHCESLTKAEAFHEHNGMIPFDGLSNEGLRRFRFAEDTAANFLERQHKKGRIQ